MSLPWSPTINPFARAINQSTPDASEIGNFTAATLAEEGDGNPAIQALADDFYPVNAAWQQKFGRVDYVLGEQKMATGNIHVLDEAMPANVRTWDLAIQGAGFVKGTPAYNLFFPKGHQAFYGKRVEVTGAPHLALRSACSLCATGHYSHCGTSHPRGIYGGPMIRNREKIEAKKGLSDTIKAQNKLLAEGLVDVLGGLTRIFKTDLPQLARFFRTDLIRSIPQTHYTGSVAADDNHFIVKRTLEADDEVTLQNAGGVPLYFYFGTAKDSAYNAQQPFVMVAAGQSSTVPASALGNVDTHHYLIVHNSDALVGGTWTVDI